LGEDVGVTNKMSLNLHAELLLRQMGYRVGDDGSSAQGARVVRQFLVQAGVDPEDFVFYDGSGMSGHDLVTPRAVARLLEYAAGQPWFAVYKASLPVGGVDGSLVNRFADAALHSLNPLKGHVFAKTGTLGEARALSGYLECASGRMVVFSIMVTDHAPGSSADRAVMDRIVAAVAAAE
jgi:D-alanyl-D-alanine carboxypeptidase/D-alanyl-D-alanine-endopeptidase (penicillin-binding protein 4)